MHSIYPLKHIWEMHQPSYENKNESIRLDEGGVQLLVWRDALTIKIEDLNNAEWKLLNLIKQEISFSDICEIFALRIEEMISLLTKISSKGWIAGFYLKGDKYAGSVNRN